MGGEEVSDIVFIPLIVMEWRGLGIATDTCSVGFIPVYQSLLDLLEVHGPDCKYLTVNKHKGKVEQ